MSDIVENDINEIIEDNIDWGYFKNKKIFLTGASGFYGSYILKTLIGANKRKNLSLNICISLRSPKIFIEKYKNLIDLHEISCFEWDINNDLTTELKDIDIIIHAASNASPKFYKDDAVGTILPNVIGTKNLLDIAKKNNSKFILISSGSVYGKITENKEIKENDFYSLDPNEVSSSYSESKRLAETLTTAYSNQFGINTKIARLFHTYGPGLKSDDGRVFSDFINDIASKNKIIIKSNGESKRSFCYISDSIRGLFNIITKDKPNRIYNLGNPNELYSVKGLAENLQKNLNHLNIEIIYSKRSADDSYTPSKTITTSPSIDRMVEDYNWSPRISAKTGFRLSIESRLRYNF